MASATVQAVLDRYAADAPLEACIDALSVRRVDAEPVTLLADAAAIASGQGDRMRRSPAVDAFDEEFVECGRVTSVVDLGTLDPDDDDLVEIFGSGRTRRVLVDLASTFASYAIEADGDGAGGKGSDAGAGDRALLTAWAEMADPYHYRDDPIGSISGVGLTTFQHLRTLAGTEAIVPDRRVGDLIEAVAREVDSPYLSTTNQQCVLASSEWMTIVSSYRPIEVDRLAWWVATNEEERETIADGSELE